MNVNPGELSKRIKFVTLAMAEDPESGMPVETETLICSRWAKVGNTSGTELIKANAELTEVKTRFLIRYTPLIDEKMQISFSGRYYDITYINDYEFKHEYMEVFGTKRELV